VGEKEEETRPLLLLHTMLDMVSNMNAVYFKMAGGKKRRTKESNNYRI
jgi:hypothetical protein